MTTADVVVFGAHPDDIEIACGGTVCKLVHQGHRVVLIDLTRGELGTRGSAELREEEAREALRILGAHARDNLGLPDGAIASTPDAIAAVIRVVRRWRPRVVLAPHAQARHPDHTRASHLVYEGVFLSGLRRVSTDRPACRPRQLLYYTESATFAPSCVVDVSLHFETKMRAVLAYRSQFIAAASDDPQTRLTSPQMQRDIEARMAHLGSMIGARYGEGFLIRGTLQVEDLLSLDFDSF